MYNKEKKLMMNKQSEVLKYGLEQILNYLKQIVREILQ